jgi:hypothetical protein
MKKIYTIVLLGIIAASLFSQVPQKMSYQAVVRDGSGVLIASKVVGLFRDPFSHHQFKWFGKC